MTSSANTERYKNHRFPGEIISHGIWPCHRFTLAQAGMQELLFELGIDVTYEAIRQKLLKVYADQSFRRGPALETHGVSTRCF